MKIEDTKANEADVSSVCFLLFMPLYQGITPGYKQEKWWAARIFIRKAATKNWLSLDESVIKLIVLGGRETGCLPIAHILSPIDLNDQQIKGNGIRLTKSSKS